MEFLMHFVLFGSKSQEMHLGWVQNNQLIGKCSLLALMLMKSFFFHLYQNDFLIITYLDKVIAAVL